MTRAVLRWAGRSISGFFGGVAVALVMVGIGTAADTRFMRDVARRHAIADAKAEAQR